jgi:hypothetical protein
MIPEVWFDGRGCFFSSAHLEAIIDRRAATPIGR